MGDEEQKQQRLRPLPKSREQYQFARALGKFCLRQLGLIQSHDEMIQDPDLSLADFSQRWQILNDVSGAPQVYCDGCLDSRLSISLAHSGDWVVCALNKSGQSIGIDIENVRPRQNMSEMVAFLAHPDEMTWLHQQTQNLHNLYRYWVAKEALAKYWKISLSAPELRQYPLIFDGDAWRIPARRLRVHHFDIPHTSYVGAWVCPEEVMNEMV